MPRQLKLKVVRPVFDPAIRSSIVQNKHDVGIDFSSWKGKRDLKLIGARAHQGQALGRLPGTVLPSGAVLDHQFRGAMYQDV
eukprot:Skav227110  [mRNA]  locus=scaffold199:424048:425830:- [translate_table: standard]